eukprot:TRINITY_DN21030_c0_g1_i1.p1 TRINITY_DN21030_c0_g1~~TRINITY_DN21030_c0_g1_i1.p1  ORF type:complete len:141 (-),score=17.25 TRINITY_DN21030_c0_g1_i1:626-1048(-)
MSLFAQRPLDGGAGSRPSTLPPSNTNGDLGAAAAMDLDNLLVQSSLLAAQIDRPEGIPLLNRSVFEIVSPRLQNRSRQQVACFRSSNASRVTNNLDLRMLDMFASSRHVGNPVLWSLQLLSDHCSMLLLAEGMLRLAAAP